MADYININGNNIPIRASDPTNPITGEIWYNTTSNSLKGQGFQAAAWSTGGSLATARYVNAGAGTLTAGLNWGGRATPIFSDTEEYNGSTWTAGGNYPKAVSSHGGTGLQTAALSVGGVNPPSPPAYSDAFEYDGTTWANPSSIGRQGFGIKVSGTQTAAVATGGGSIGGPEVRNTTDTELYDGTSWTAANPFSTARSFHGTGGTEQTTSIIVGGRTGTSPNEVASTAVEEYDGTSWTAGTGYPVTIKENNGWGTTTDYIQAGGSTPTATNLVALYNGTTWTTGTSLPAPVTLNATSQGTYNTNSGLVFGGSSSGASAVTSEWTGAGPATVTISSS